MIISTQHLEKIAQAIYPQGQLNKFKTLTGGVSAQTIRLDITLPEAQIQKVVLRQHGEIDRKLNPNIAQDEHRLLRVLFDVGLTVPKPIYVDTSNTITDIPYLVIEYVEHDPFDETSITVYQIQQVAELLREIHQVDLSKHDLSFLPDAMDALQSRLNTPPSNATQHIHEALIQALPHLKLNISGLLHGDSWLGNLLWRNGEIVAVIDWEDAMRGDPLCDLGKSRLEISWASGKNRMQTYTNFYLSLMPHLDTTYLPFWDLYGAFRLADFASWFEDENKVQAMQAHHDWFVDSAIQQLT